LKLSSSKVDLTAHAITASDMAISDLEKMALAMEIAEHFILREEGEDGMARANEHLEGMGFNPEWIVNDDGDRLILILERFGSWKGDYKIMDNFIVKFSGHDAALIQVYGLVGEESI